MELSIIKNKIHKIQGNKVILDFDLAELFDVKTRVLKEAVRRNLKRFPDDFMFQLSKDEWKEVITNCDNLPENIKFSPATPFAFTEIGVAMLSSVLNSDKAIDVNISIMRAFVALRQHLTDYSNLKEQIAEIEKEMNIKFKDIHQAMNYLLQKDKVEIEQQNRERIGFITGKKNLKLFLQSFQKRKAKYLCHNRIYSANSNLSNISNPTVWQK